MLEYLQDTANYLWLLDFLAWGIFCWFAFKDKRASSSLVTLTLVLVIDGLMNKFDASVSTIFDWHHTQLVKVIYYGGYALFDILAIVLIYRVHKVLNVDYKFLARTYLLAYFLLAWCQILRLAERLYFDGNVLKNAYTIAIAAINTGTAVTGLLMAVMTVYIAMSKTRIGGTIWKI